jgi:hypothetical protein
LRRRQGYAKSKGMPITSSPADPPLPTSTGATGDAQGNKRPLRDAAIRALAEAAARRNEPERIKAETTKAESQDEIGGRGGLDPTRYGDWEFNGLASDF